jgi:hypothetical protein
MWFIDSHELFFQLIGSHLFSMRGWRTPDRIFSAVFLKYSSNEGKYFKYLSESFINFSSDFLTSLKDDVNPCFPKISLTTCFLTLSLTPILFVKYQQTFSSKWREQSIFADDGKHCFIAFISAASSSDPITILDSCVPPMSTFNLLWRCKKNLWYVV